MIHHLGQLQGPARSIHNTLFWSPADLTIFTYREDPATDLDLMRRLHDRQVRCQQTDAWEVDTEVQSGSAHVNETYVKTRERDPEELRTREHYEARYNIEVVRPACPCGSTYLRVRTEILGFSVVPLGKGQSA